MMWFCYNLYLNIISISAGSPGHISMQCCTKEAKKLNSLHEVVLLVLFTSAYNPDCSILQLEALFLPGGESATVCRRPATTQEWLENNNVNVLESESRPHCNPIIVCVLHLYLCVLTCTWWTCSMEKSLLKQALNMGMDEGWTIRLLPGGEPPPWRALSRESSVPLEVWLTESQTRSKSYSHDTYRQPKQTTTGTETVK